MYTIEEKLRIIDAARDFEEVRNAGILPEPDADDGYYFVSYSHLDYKRVLTDILELQSRGIKIWYDRGLETGSSWLEDVCRKIDSFYCKGVIIYISENLIGSAACRKEIRQTQLSKKSCLGIRLADAVSDEEFSFFSVIDMDASYREKVGAIGALPAPELYEFEICKGIPKYLIKPFAVLTAVNDRGIQKAYIPPYLERDGKRYPVRGIGLYAFANCTNLAEVTVPDGWISIYHAAFANCYSLKTVNFGRPYRVFGLLAVGAITESFINCTALETLNCFHIDKKTGLGGIALVGAFQNCISLKQIDIPKDFIFALNCFSGCSALEYVKFNGMNQCVGAGMFAYDPMLKKVEYDNSKHAERDVPPYAYFFSGIKSIDLPKQIETIGCRAFAGCRDLAAIDLPKRLKKICEGAFAESGLKILRIPKHVNAVSYSAFEATKDLKTVFLEGKAIKIDDNGGRKDTAIDELFPFAETIYCKKGSKYKLSDRFRAVFSDSEKYQKYVRNCDHA